LASIKKNNKDKIIADLITGDKADILITDAYPYWLCKWTMRRMHEISRIFFFLRLSVHPVFLFYYQFISF